MKRFFNHAASWLRNEDNGNTTIEFVMLFPLFITIFLSSVEAGVLMTRQIMLDRALDMSVRDLRLGAIPDLDHDTLKQRICDDTLIIPDCLDTVLLELRPVSTNTWEPLNAAATCVERDEEIQPVTQFINGGDSEMMIVRACAVFDPFFPGTGLGLRLPKDASGAYGLIATSAFVNEPS